MSEFESDDESLYGDPSPSFSLPTLETLVALAPSANIRIFGSTIQWDLPLTTLGPSHRALLGLLSSAPIRVQLDCRSGTDLPKIEISQAISPQVTWRSTEDRSDSRFGIGVALMSAAKRVLKEHWGKDSTALWQALPDVLQTRLAACGEHCMLCDNTLDIAGVKPTVCDEALCNFQFEELGLGSDIHLFKNDSAVADLLLSVAIAAGSESSRSQFAMPKLPKALALERNLDGQTIAETLRLIPKPDFLSTLDSEVGSALRSTHIDALALTRWVFATNRAHLTSLPESERMECMLTPHQFRIHSATRVHEQAFASNKMRYGSHFAFHGSDFGNWHNILRTNLANASGTPMMSTGAAYGSGVYLAEWSETSRDYMRPPSHGWANSSFGDKPLCLAICEVANAPSTQRHGSGIIVVADPTCVTLRYLCVYPNVHSLPSVAAKDLPLNTFANDICLISREPVGGIPKDRFLMTRDNYAWDIEELVDFIISKHGLFINGFTNVGLCGEDVEAILNHPSGAGRKLRALEEENTGLRAMISLTTRKKIRDVGQTLIQDNSEDFAASQIAITSLNKYIASLPARERDALARAPFSCVDSHTRRPFRSTVVHELTLAASGGDCVHRTGDFLTQVGQG